MKTEIRMALLVLASASAPAFAQDIPQCAALFDSANNYFTSNNAPAGATNRQCFLTVMPKDGANSVADFPRLSSYPNPQIGEGRYEILLSGGGGGGGAGGLLSSGGGGAGAVPSKTTQYLAPGVYKLTIGTTGHGGTNGGAGADGHPTSITNAYSNELVAGFKGADSWVGDGTVGNGRDSAGARGVNGQGNGGHGGRHADKNGNGEIQSESGGMMRVAGVTTGTPGVGGSNEGGGGGGAGFGSGGDGKSSGSLGNAGGNGFVRLSPIQLAQATPVAPAPVAAPAPAYVAPVRSTKKDRN